MNVNMAERRRRKCTDAGSDESGDDTVIHEHSDISDGANSEYESVDEDELGEEEEEGEGEVAPETGDDSNKPLDDDEDRKNPQYIPKRGTFYEHDDRTAEESEEKSPRDEKETEKSTPQDKKPDPKKKVWKDDDSKWNHDRFIDFDQSPKTREELVATYGYDIRNEEGPPRARRRRRYGRGPNKYTRNWEDFDAYSRPSRGSSGGASPNPRGGERGRGRGKRHSLNSEEEFPSLVPNNTQKDLPNVEDEETYVNSIPSLEITLSENQKTTYDNQNISNNSKLTNAQNSPRPIMDESRRYSNDKNRRHPNEENRRHPNEENRRHPNEENRRYPNEENRRHGNDDNRRHANDDNRRHPNDENRRHGNDENRRYGADDNRRQVNDENRRESGGRGRGTSRRGGRAGPRGGGIGQQPRDSSNIGGQQDNHWNDHIKGGRFDKGRGQNFSRTGHSNNHIPTAVFHQQQKDIVDVVDELKTMTITPSNKEEHHYSNSKRGTDTRKTTLPPRLQDIMRGNKSPIQGDINATSSKPKRYSSQRQRTVQDQVMYQQGYYEPNPNEVGFQSNLYEARNNASPITNAHPVSIPPTQLTSLRPINAPPSFVAPSFASSPVYPQEPFLGRPTGPRLTAIVAQPHLIGPGGPLTAGPPPLAGPAMPGASVAPVTGPHFLPPENMINFAAGAPPGLVTGPHPPQFPAGAFQAFTPVSQQQPQEIYSNGTMYYNTQSQQHIPRSNPVLQKRPKAAIPILPPPDHQTEEGDVDYDDNYENYPENSNREYEPRLNDNYEENYNEEYEPRLNEGYPDNSNEEYDDSQANKNYSENSSGEYEPHLNEENYEDNDSGDEYEPEVEKNCPENSNESCVPPVNESYSPEVDLYSVDNGLESIATTEKSTEPIANLQPKELTNTENKNVPFEVEDPVPVAKDNLSELTDSNVALNSESKVTSFNTDNEENLQLGECPDSVQEEFIDASEDAHQGDTNKVITSEISELKHPDDTECSTKNNLEQIESSNISNSKIGLTENPEILKESTVEENSLNSTITDLSSNDVKNSLTNSKENIDSTTT